MRGRLVDGRNTWADEAQSEPAREGTKLTKQAGERPQQKSQRSYGLAHAHLDSCSGKLRARARGARLIKDNLRDAKRQFDHLLLAPTE